MKLVIRILINRITFLVITLLLQLLVIIGVIIKFNEYFSYFYLISTMISLLIVFLIVNKTINPVYKIAWIIPILIFPIFGGVFYLFFGTTRFRKSIRRKMVRFMENQVIQTLKTNKPINPNLFNENPDARIQSQYITNTSHYPVYEHTQTEYLPLGEKMFERLMEELKKAEHYIFLEYFIIEEGVMWNTILELLVEKAKQGVDVRVIYDDIGCLKTLPYKYYKRLRKLGIKCSVFNPVIPILSPWLNHRDHRKITVIDGVIGFTGGVNLADEYINEKERFGHWKDAVILLKGDAVWSLTVMFLSLWNYLNNITEDMMAYKPSTFGSNKNQINANGLVQPYADSPLDDEPVGEAIYLNLINKAKDYIFITTPYLIIDNEMAAALTLAAKSGIDVRILTPAIPDKRYVHEVTRSFYPLLIKSGVKIYEYTPGFIHSKTFVVDDIYAVVGTINLDYRSLYLHFECGVWLYKTNSVINIKDDFLDTIEHSKEISIIESTKINWYRSLYRFIVRLFSPLM
jgi:cardiolipin synthase A/B